MQEIVTVIGLFIGSFVGVIGVGISLLEYRRISKEKEKANEIMSFIFVLKSVLHYYFESTKTFYVRYKMEKNGETSDSEIGDFQQAYRKTLELTRDTIRELFRNGHIVYLFPPGSPLFNLLSNMLFLLEVDLGKADPFLGSKGELKIPENPLVVCIHCLEELSKLDSRSLAYSIRQKMRQFTDAQEIEVIKHGKTAIKSTSLEKAISK